MNCPNADQTLYVETGAIEALADWILDRMHHTTFDDDIIAEMEDGLERIRKSRNLMRIHLKDYPFGR